MSTLKAIAVWALILPLAIMNGAFREAVLLPGLGNPWAQMLSGLLLSACIIAVAAVFVPRIVRGGAPQPHLVGILWLALTLVFEFGFGRLVAGRSWTELFAAYTFADGNIWPLVLVVTATAPSLAVWFAGKHAKRRHADGVAP
jgi:hypothetical protein